MADWRLTRTPYNLPALRIRLGATRITPRPLLCAGPRRIRFANL